jgi:transcription-repair coupling factor (superfamily II helicase)
VHTRLTLYKRIASAADDEQLRELQVEMIDRFGLLPEPVKHLFAITELKLKAVPLGISKIDAGEENGRLLFGPEPNVDPATIITLIQTQPQHYSLEGGDKIRFRFPMPTAEQRFAGVGTLLQRLSATPDSGRIA